MIFRKNFCENLYLEVRKLSQREAGKGVGGRVFSVQFSVFSIRKNPKLKTEH